MGKEDNTAWLDSLLNEIWAIVKKDSLASSRVGSPTKYTRDAMQQAILSHFGTSDSKSISEMREQIMQILGLEKDLQGQIVLRDIEDLQSNWEYAVEAILSCMLTSSNKKPGEDISKPGDASNIVAALEEIKKVGLEFDKNFSGTVAYNCLLNRIADLQPEASEVQSVNSQVANPILEAQITALGEIKQLEERYHEFGEGQFEWGVPTIRIVKRIQELQAEDVEGKENNYG